MADDLAFASRAGVGAGSRDVGIMLGEDAATTFHVRDVAPDVLLVGNIGLAQLSREVVPQLRRALGGVGASF